MARYYQSEDGEWIRPKKKGYREQCCGCGLVHVLDFRIIDGHIEVRATQDARATAAVRRAFKFEPESES